MESKGEEYNEKLKLNKKERIRKTWNKEKKCTQNHIA
jgi:hypothetical protein